MSLKHGWAAQWKLVMQVIIFLISLKMDVNLHYVIAV